jgi:hypothetical protein
MIGSTDPSSGDQRSVPTPSAPWRGFFRRLLRLTGQALLGVVMLGMLLWAALAVYFADTHAGPRTIRALLFALASIAVLFVRPRRYGVGAFALFFVIVLGWFFSLKPSNDRNWAPEVARIPWSKIDGDRLTMHNIRNFDYRSETDYTPDWVNRTYDLSKLRSGDMMLVYWGSKAIAHGMVSFGFEDGQYLAVSVETRKEQTESFSTVQGFFRQYELVYIFADERDLIRLRTNFRHEDVYLYHVSLTPDQLRKLLLSYLRSANSLKDQPAFYNALTSNCVTSILPHARDAGLPGTMSWDILASGYAARQAYRNGYLDTSLPFETLEARSRVNDAANAAGNDPDFSKLIRAGLPNPAMVAAGTSAKSMPAATRRAP